MLRKVEIITIYQEKEVRIRKESVRFPISTNRGNADIPDTRRAMLPARPKGIVHPMRSLLRSTVHVRRGISHDTPDPGL
jgi:hypothetical protein